MDECVDVGEEGGKAPPGDRDHGCPPPPRRGAVWMERMRRGSVKGREGGGVGKLMTICACEQVSAKKEEEGGRRKVNGKVCASKQVSTLPL